MKFLKKYIIIFLFMVFKLFAQENANIKVTIIGNHDEERKLVVTNNEENNRIFNIEKTLSPYTSIPSICQLTNGNLALVFELEGIIEIINLNGNKISTHNFYKLPPYNEQVIKYKKNRKGIYLVVSENQTNQIYFIDNNGNIENSFEVNSGLLRGFTISEDLEYFAYSISNWNADKLESASYILDSNSDLISEFNFDFEKGNFDENSNLFLAHNKSNARLIDIENNNIYWETELDNNNLYLDSFIQSKNVILIKSEKPNFVDNKWVYNNGKIEKKSIDGKIIYETRINKPFEKIELIKNNNELILETDKETIEIK